MNVVLSGARIIGRVRADTTMGEKHKSNYLNASYNLPALGMQQAVTHLRIQPLHDGSNQGFGA